MKTFKLNASADDLQLGVMVVEPEGTPTGLLQLVHGMCEHKERYLPFMNFMASHGYVCIIHDHRGHGESVKFMDDLGYMYKGGWKALVEDTLIVSRWAENEYPNLPHDLLGHSMGSMVVRSFAKRYDKTIEHLIVCGCPSDNSAKGIGKCLAKCISFFKGERYHSPLLLKLSFGEFNKPFEKEGWESAWVCSNPETLKAYHEDPLCRFSFTANGYVNLFSLMQDCYSAKGWKVENPDLKVNFISGADDPCAGSEKDINKAVELMRKAGYANVSLKLYKGMRHEILNESDKAMVWEDVLKILSE